MTEIESVSPFLLLFGDNERFQAHIWSVAVGTQCPQGCPAGLSERANQENLPRL